MAGVICEVRSAQELPDRISIGVLSRTFPQAVLDEVFDAPGVREQRYRRLPARLMMGVHVGVLAVHAGGIQADAVETG